MEATKSVFETLNVIDVSAKTEKKGRLTYLSWSWAWAEVKKRYPDAFYTVYENRNGWNYHTDGRTCWVKTGVTINGLELIEYLPVMDNMNKSIRAERVTSFDVNKAIQRSITKACARHGLGLYIYAGEDLPEDAEPAPQKTTKPARKATTATQPNVAQTTDPSEDPRWKNHKCEHCGKTLEPHTAAASFAACKGHYFCDSNCREEFKKIYLAKQAAQK